MAARLVSIGTALFIMSVSNVAAFEQIALTDQWVYVDDDGGGGISEPTATGFIFRADSKDNQPDTDIVAGLFEPVRAGPGLAVYLEFDLQSRSETFLTRGDFPHFRFGLINSSYDATGEGVEIDVALGTGTNAALEIRVDDTVPLAGNTLFDAPYEALGAYADPPSGGGIENTTDIHHFTLRLGLVSPNKSTVDVWWENTTSGGIVYASAELPFDIVNGLDILGFGVKGTRDAIFVISNIKVRKGYVTAHDPSPAHQATGVPAGPVTLAWAPLPSIEDESVPDPGLLRHELYVRKGSADFAGVTPIVVVVDADGDGRIDGRCSWPGAIQVAVDDVVYWRVDEVLVEGGQQLSLEGPVWMFEAVKSTPIVVREPNDVVVSPGETAETTAEFTITGGAGRYRRNRELLHNTSALETEDHLTDLFTERAVDFLRAHRDRPFFCYLPYNAVHGPMWRTENPQPSGKEEWLKKYEERGVDFPRRDYCAILDHMDDSAGRILKTLRELGLEKDTLFILVSDNGAMIDEYPGRNGPLRGAKGTTYEGGIRVPAVMQWPRVIPAGMVSQASAVHFDVFSTILDAAGVAIPQRNGDMPIRSVSLLPHLKSGGKTKFADRPLFWDLYGRMAAVEGPWKIVATGANHHGHFSKTIPVVEQTDFELFNLDQDIGETRNLAQTHPDVYRKLKGRYVEWFKEMAANYERKSASSVTRTGL